MVVRDRGSFRRPCLFSHFSYNDMPLLRVSLGITVRESDGSPALTALYTEPAAKGNKMQMSPFCSSSSPPCTTTTSPPQCHHKERGEGGAHNFCNPPPAPSCPSLIGTDQMASELLNVQQLLASPVASPSTTQYTGLIYIPTFFFFLIFCTKSSTSQHQVILIGSSSDCGFR